MYMCYECISVGLRAIFKRTDKTKTRVTRPCLYGTWPMTFQAQQKPRFVGRAQQFSPIVFCKKMQHFSLSFRFFTKITRKPHFLLLFVRIGLTLASRGSCFKGVSGILTGEYVLAPGVIKSIALFRELHRKNGKKIEQAEGIVLSV